MMANTTTEKDQGAPASKRTPEQEAALARLLKMAEEQGVKPLSVDDLLAMGDVWPADESVDDFIAAVQEWRSEDGERELP